MLAPSDWQIQLLPLLLNNMGQDSLPARWVVPGNRGDSHWAQEKREKLCKMITLVLSIYAVILFKDLSCWGTCGFFTRVSVSAAKQVP